jgi:hypothetical protein
VYRDIMVPPFIRLEKKQAFYFNKVLCNFSNAKDPAVAVLETDRRSCHPVKFGQHEKGNRIAMARLLKVVAGNDHFGQMDQHGVD